VRVVKRGQQKYQWGDGYGGREVGHGGAQFRFRPAVNLDFSGGFLTPIAASDPEAEPGMIEDQAGVHDQPGEARLPAHIQRLPLPPYSPELKPTDQSGERIKAASANRVFGTLHAIEDSLTAALRPFWADRQRVLAVLGAGCLHPQANAS